MYKKLIYALGFAAISAATVAFSPKPLDAQGRPGEEACPCNGGCEGYANYNYCGGGRCSWFCTGG